MLNKKSFLALKKWKMIFIKIIWKLFLPTMFAIPRHTYVSNMDTLSQIMARVHFDHLKKVKKYSKNEIVWHGVLLCVLVARKNDKPEF